MMGSVPGTTYPNRPSHRLSARLLGFKLGLRYAHFSYWNHLCSREGILWAQVHWARFKSQLGTGSALSESAIEASAGESTEGSSNYRRYVEKSGGRNTPAVGLADDGPVDEIVVDNQVGLIALLKLYPHSP
jgi:hypothetical protein